MWPPRESTMWRRTFQFRWGWTRFSKRNITAVLFWRCRWKSVGVRRESCCASLYRIIRIIDLSRVNSAQIFCLPSLVQAASGKFKESIHPRWIWYQNFRMKINVPVDAISNFFFTKLIKKKKKEILHRRLKRKNLSNKWKQFFFFFFKSIGVSFFFSNNEIISVNVGDII